MYETGLRNPSTTFWEPVLPEKCHQQPKFHEKTIIYQVEFHEKTIIYKVF